MGKRWQDMVEAIESGIGGAVPDTFSDDLRAAILARFRTDLREVEGASAFIRRFVGIPSCIASSSSAERLRLCLEVLGLSEVFGGNVFSADMVTRGKPAPDLFLLAAGKLGVAPADCVVIEDSVGGVLAGVSAGMRVIGLCAGSHLRDGHAERLLRAGALHVAASWRAVEAIVAPLVEE
jgi:beta-phosphoglucomutase-like phosphatase (HAD superfamily)